MYTEYTNKCIKCGGDMIGDGYTSVIHCEYAEDVDFIEPDGGPIYCDFVEDDSTIFTRSDVIADIRAIHNVMDTTMTIMNSHSNAEVLLYHRVLRQEYECHKNYISIVS